MVNIVLCEWFNDTARTDLLTRKAALNQDLARMKLTVNRSSLVLMGIRREKPCGFRSGWIALIRYADFYSWWGNKRKNGVRKCLIFSLMLWRHLIWKEPLQNTAKMMRHSANPIGDINAGNSCSAIGIDGKLSNWFKPRLVGNKGLWIHQRFHRVLQMDIGMVNELKHLTVEDLNFTWCKRRCLIVR